MFTDRTTGGRRTAPATAVRAVGAMLLVAGMCAPAVIATAATPTEPGASGLAQRCRDGWAQLEDMDGTLFVNVGSCVSYGASGGVLVPRNQAPVAVDDTERVVIDIGGVVEVLANDTDPDGDALTVSVTGAPSHGTTSVGPTGEIEYVPSQYYTGEDSFTYTIDDGRGGTDSATVRMTIVMFPFVLMSVDPWVIKNDITTHLSISLAIYDLTGYSFLEVTFTDADGTIVSIPPDPKTEVYRVPVTIDAGTLAPGTYDLGVVASNGQLTYEAVLGYPVVVE